MCMGLSSEVLSQNDPGKAVMGVVGGGDSAVGGGLG